ncbi:hypothetical protein MH117_22860 [Paenibacillus sp. ACRRX]|nr:hypothetical protein [Paenibacillus sp. ACRRX]MCG7410258.1 hypothetical protein [Paenibacillus sp. ACRRX]
MGGLTCLTYVPPLPCDWSIAYDAAQIFQCAKLRIVGELLTLRGYMR